MQILITGTGKGLGESLALHYLEKGETVYGISRKKSSSLKGYSNFHFLEQDLTRFSEMKETISSFIREIEKLDLAILNAGILPGIKDMKDISMEEIRNTMDINVWSNKILLDIINNSVPSVIQIAAVSSGAAVYGSRGWNAYSISKAALNMLIKLYAKEQPDTHFSAIAPGLIDTGMQDYIYSVPDDPRFSSLERLKEAKRDGQMPKPREAAKIFAAGIIKAKNSESGSFLDVRDM